MPGGPVAVQSRLWFNEANDSQLLSGAGADRAGHDAHRRVADLPGHGPRVGARHAGGAVRDARSADEILLSKTIPYFALGMIGLALCLLAAKFLFHVPFRGSILVLVGASMLYLLVALGIGLLISSAIKNQFVASLIDDARDLPAGDDAFGVHLRPAQHAGGRPG